MTKACLLRILKTMKDSMNDIYNSGVTHYELFCKLNHLCRDISESEDFKCLSILETKQVIDEFKELLEEKFMILRKV